MSEQEIKSDLCYYDPENPNNNLGAFDDEDRPQPRNKCSCDNCFYGRDKLAMQLLEARRERDEAREAFIEARKHREQFNSLLQNYEACWEEIKTALGEPEKGDQTCDLDRVLKAIRERDDARAVANELSDVASKHLSFLLAITPTSPNDTHEKETEKVIDALKRWKKL